MRYRGAAGVPLQQVNIDGVTPLMRVSQGGCLNLNGEIVPSTPQHLLHNSPQAGDNKVAKPRTLSKSAKRLPFPTDCSRTAAPGLLKSPEAAEPKNTLDGGQPPKNEISLCHFLPFGLDVPSRWLPEQRAQISPMPTQNQRSFDVKERAAHERKLGFGVRNGFQGFLVGGVLLGMRADFSLAHLEKVNSFTSITRSG